MVNRQKNLLEAFTASANAEKAASEDPAVTGSPSGGPFAPGRGSEERFEKPVGTLTDTLLHPENRGGLIALVAVFITLAFLAGMMTGKDEEVAGVAAAGREPVAGPRTERVPAELPRTEKARSEPEPEAEGQKPMSPAEKALADTRNKYTVKLVEYQRFRDEDHQWRTMNYLEDLGLPAAALFRDKRLFIVLGAAPTQVELDALLKRAKTLTGPPPNNTPNEFSDAYVEKIDNLLVR